MTKNNLPLGASLRVHRFTVPAGVGQRVIVSTGRAVGVFFPKAGAFNQAELRIALGRTTHETFPVHEGLWISEPAGFTEFWAENATAGALTVEVILTTDPLSLLL